MRDPTLHVPTDEFPPIPPRARHTRTARPYLMPDCLPATANPLALLAPHVLTKGHDAG